MGGSRALYCAGTFLLVSRLRAAVMASGDGVCACEAQTDNRSMPAMINRRLDIYSSNDRSRDETRKWNFADKRIVAFTRVFGADQCRETASGDHVCPDKSYPIGPREKLPARPSAMNKAPDDRAQGAEPENHGGAGLNSQTRPSISCSLRITNNVENSARDSDHAERGCS